MKDVKLFHSAREAKEFLACRIVDEANREGTPLSDVERKMLYFSETDWTLPDIGAVSEEFDRTQEQDEYEAKIAGLIKVLTRMLSRVLAMSMTSGGRPPAYSVKRTTTFS